MSDGVHIYEGEEEAFESEAKAYEFLGRKFCLLFGGFPRNSHVKILLRSPPRVYNGAALDEPGPEYKASFRVSVKSVRNHG